MDARRKTRILFGGISGLAVGGAGAAALAYDAVPSVAAAYGMRRLLTAYTGNLIRLRRSSDNAESDFGYVANSDLDTAALATWLGGGSGYVVTWYDQSGNGNNATQSTATSQPLYVASGQNGKPVLRWDNSNDGLVTTITVGASYSVMAAQDLVNPGAGSPRLWSARGDTHYIIPSNGGANHAYRNGTSDYSVAPAINTPALFAIIGDTAWLNAVSEGTITTGALSAGALIIGNRAALDRPLSGDIFEVVVASAAWGTADRQAAEAAANAYWAIY